MGSSATDTLLNDPSRLMLLGRNLNLLVCGSEYVGVIQEISRGSDVLSVVSNRLRDTCDSGRTLVLVVTYGCDGRWSQDSAMFVDFVSVTL